MPDSTGLAASSGSTTPNMVEQNPAVTLSVLIAILSVFLALFVYYFLRRDAERDPVRYTIMADIQALIVTVFASFITVATGVSAQLTTARYAIVGFTASIAGPFVLWIVARHILAPTSARLQELFQNGRSHDGAIARCEKSLDWQTYQDWHASLGLFAGVLSGSGELQFINDMLPRVYYHGNESIVRPTKPRISTVFVYLEAGSSFKVQVIRGSYRGAGGRPQVFLPGTASAPGGKVSSIYFLSEGETVKKTSPCQNGEWLLVPYDSFEICVVSQYDGDETGEGDYVAIDPGKYMEINAEIGIGVDVTLVSRLPMEKPRSWDMSASVAAGRRPAPLIFRSATQVWTKGEKSRQTLRNSIGEWVSRIKATAENDGAEGDDDNMRDVRNMLSSFSEEFAKFHKWLHAPSSPTDSFTTFSCTRRKQSHVFISVVEWKSSVDQNRSAPIGPELEKLTPGAS